MQELTVFLAPAGPADGVLDALADLSGAGLVDRFLWVSETDIRRGEHVATVVDGGRRSEATVEGVIADGRLQRVRLCVVVPLELGAAVVSSQTEQQLGHIVEWQSGRGVRVTRVRCLLAPPGITAPPDAVARDGWHNVLIAPEDSRGPDSGLTLETAIDPISVGRYAAPVVAGVIGLWTGMTTTGLDRLPAPAGPNARAVRSFYRRVDADDVERSLRARVFATQPELPLPKDHTASTVYIEQIAPACAKAASDLWRRHAWVLRGPRVDARAKPPKDLGWLTAIRWLWGFLVAAVKRAPEEWYHAKAAQFSSAVAKRVHKGVLGSDPSAYRVVVNGMTARGPAGWQDLRAASEYFDALNFDPELPVQQEPRVDLSPLWSDFVSGALTLCDAGDRVPDMPPYQVGASRGVLRTVEDCVPAPEDDFTAIPGHFAAQTGISRVQAGDAFGAETLRQHLQRLAQDPAFALDANRTAHGLTAWARRHAHTYALQVGTTLTTNMFDRLKEIGWYMQRLQEAAADEESESAAQTRRRRRTAVLLVVLTVIAFVVLAASVGLAIAERIGVRTAIIIAVAALLWWLVTSVVSFALSQRELFRTLTRRQILLTEVDAIRTNLRQAIRDLRRLSDAYGQYLLWTRLIGRFLRQPYGPPSTPETVGMHIVRGLPRTTRIARAEVDETAMGWAAGRLREDLYRTGWLREPWDATVAAAPARLGPRGHELSRVVFDLQGRPLDRSALQAWGDLVVRDGIETATGDIVWYRLRGALAAEGPHAALGNALLSSVRGIEEGAPPPGPLAEFLSGIDQSQVRSGQRFLSDHFTAEAVTRETPDVVIDDPAGWRLGLSGALVLVQYTAAVPAHWFRVGEQPPPGPKVDTRKRVETSVNTGDGRVGAPELRSEYRPEHPRDDYSVDGPVF